MRIEICHEHETDSTLYKMLEQLILTQTYLVVTSVDVQDKGQTHEIETIHISCIEDVYDNDDNVALRVWWAQWNGFKWLDNSATFHEFTFKNK